MKFHRTPLQHFLRAIVLVLAVCGPLLWPTSVPVAAAVVGALLAYDGTEHRALLGVTILLIVAELIGGMHLGIVSLPFLIAAVLLLLAGRIFSVAPWAGTDGWQPGDLLRTVVLGAVLGVAISVGSVLVSALVYDLGALVTRMRLVLNPATLAAVAIWAAVTIITLRRIDVPFRHTIRFGV